jgi:hypothetical protein
MTTNDQSTSPDFDEAGVANYIKDKRVLNWFRKTVQRYEVPLAKQAGLAAVFLNEAVRHNKGRLTLPFLRDRNYQDYIPSFIEYGDTEVDEKTGEQIKLEAVKQQVKREWQNSCGACASSSTAATRWMGCSNNIHRFLLTFLTARTGRFGSPNR